jgi:tryptophan synthase alpha chain
MSRIQARFAALKAEGRAGLVTFVTAGDPDMATFEAVLARLPGAGADLIEVGMPFSDPMADGPAIQAAGLRALKRGTKLAHILAAVARFRQRDAATPIVLMGYYNPVFRFGAERFVAEAAKVGVDGLIIVDLPPEEAAELAPFAKAAGLDFIRLTTPTTHGQRLSVVLDDASGFIYHVAIAGITGTRTAEVADVSGAVERLKQATSLPVAVGFGLKTPDQAAAIARIADAAVVGSAIVDNIARHLTPDGAAGPGLVEAVAEQVAGLARGVRQARLSA